MTLRDDAWDAVMETIYETDQFKLSDLPFDDSQRHTVRRVLRKMEEAGWLAREHQHSAIWRRGPTAKALLDIEGL